MKAFICFCLFLFACGARTEPTGTTSSSLSGVPFIVVDGDSIAYGYGAQPYHSTTSWAARVWQQDHGITVADMAIEGATAADRLNIASLRIDPLLKTGAWLIFAAGTNDIQAGSSASTVFNSISSYCTIRNTAGWHTILMTIIPRGSFNATQESIRQEVNTSILAQTNCPVVDVASDPGLTPPDPTLNSNYFDKTHPNAAGYQLMATDVEEALGL